MNSHVLYNVTIQAQRVELRVPTDAEIEGLAHVLTAGIQQQDQPHFMEDDLYDKSEEEHIIWLKDSINTSVYKWKSEDWDIPFAVFHDSKVVGLVTMLSRQFPITRVFHCSYWIGLSYQGKGFGTEAFQAVLSFGFDGLHAREAYVGAYADNFASLRLMEKSGFIFNGEHWMARQGKAIKDKRMRLPSESWKTPADVTILGLKECMYLFMAE